MGEHERILLRKVYVWRAALFGLLYGLLFGALFITTALGTIQYVSQARGITPPIAGPDMVFFGAVFTLVFAFLFSVGIIIAVLLYNIIAKMGGGLHVELEEKSISTDVLAVRAV